MSTFELKDLDPSDISEHPLLKNISLLPTEKYEVLKATIAVRGIEHPVTCLPGRILEGKQQYLLIDGRHRLKAAQELRLCKFPAVIRPAMSDEQTLKFILDAAVTGRQLTKSGIALMLFECNPAMIENRKARTGGRPRKAKPAFADTGFPANKDGHIVETEAETSFTEMAEDYHVPRDYFSRLATIRENCRPWPDDKDFEWKLVKRWIIEDEMGITRLLPALEGYQLTHSLGKDKTQIKATGKLPTNLQDGFSRSFRYLSNQFSKWETLGRPQKNELIEMWYSKVLPSLPKDLRCAQSK
jgi:hypothetical protein